MKVMRIEIADQLAEEMEALVKAGWFASETEIAHPESSGRGGKEDKENYHGTHQN